MKVKGLLLRYFIGCLALLIIAVLTLHYFDPEGISDINRGVFTAITAWGYGLINWVCIAFAKKNGRYFTSREKVLTVAGIVTITLLMQLMLISGPVFSNTPVSESGGSSALTLICIGVLQTIFIYYLVDSSKKTFQSKI